MTEIWADIAGYEGKYQVSSFGSVRSLDYRNTGRAKIMEPQDNGHGYLYIGLRDGTKRRDYRYVHRLVAETFIPNPLNLPTINHLDENKRNNVVANLAWCTIAENLSYGSRHTKEIETQRRTHPNRKAVAQYSLDGKLVRVYGSQREAERETGIPAPNISSCANGRLRTCGGFIFAFYNNSGQQRGQIKVMEI